ncbi:MAG TPA: UDP-N-acetylmuramoyl-L-alanine--D-glutamate ligase [Clostridiaceae bacterium]|nr:UDP-N-acetylmuramoyl-L-alanine--D-glutamate ligase [Clostridiaceae bacterium]
MNTKLEEFKKKIKSKKTAVLGIGISNTPLIKFLASMGVDVTAFDKAERDEISDTLKKLEGLNIKYCLGKDYLKGLKGFDVIFKTPVIRFDIPELEAERARGAEVTSEMEVFMELCPAQIFGVTGSDGKTTTTTLVYKILKEEGYNCWLGGNIGTPLLERVGEISEEDKVVLELSSFQLHTMKKSPDIAVITNITPNHLDVHKSMEEYIDAKCNIFRYQNSGGRLVLNYDNDITRSFAPLAKSEVIFFSSKNSLDIGSFLRDNSLVYKKGNNITHIVNTDEILIPGLHNIENYLAAIGAVYEYVKPETIRKIASTFKGVEHRIELVREIDGVKFYNSSIDSTPNRTIAALNTFKQKVILIAGGKDKNLPYDSLGKAIVDKVKCLVLIGMNINKIEKALLDEIERSGRGYDIPVYKCSTYEEAVRAAFSAAQPGDAVLLSPASTSFDMFRNFEERGNKFKEIVMCL